MTTTNARSASRSRYIIVNPVPAAGCVASSAVSWLRVSLVTKQILIIDDDVDSWRLLSTILESHNFHPVWAADGIQAVAATRRYQPSAILLDLGMPGGDGLLVLERLKSNRLLSHIPVIVVTVRDRQEAEEQTRRLGAADYVSKPIDADALIASLQTVLATSDRPPEGGAVK
jgi:DNA-binding response OmpR family regulator